MSMSRVVCWGSLALVLLSSTAASAQSLQFVECPEVNLLEPACASTMVDDVPMLSPAPPPEEPLFTLQTMRPDTPPLLVKVFNDPSEANIRAFKEWQHRYLSRTLEVERLLKAYDRNHKP